MPQFLAASSERIEGGEPAPAVMTYAACQRGVPGGVVVLAINLDLERSVAVSIDGVSAARAEVYVATAPDLYGKDVVVNGRALRASEDGAPPSITPSRVRIRAGAPLVTLPPTSYAFVALPDAAAPGCG